MIAPDANFRIVGQKIARQSPRYSGRTAMNANVKVSEAKPPEDTGSPLSYSMEGFSGIPPAPLIPRFWSPGWNSMNSVTKFQAEINGSLRGGDPGIRLINPSDANRSEYFQTIPNAFSLKEDQFLFFPLHNIFGSSESGYLSPAISERIPSPSLIMNQADAMTLKILDKVLVSAEIGSRIYPATVNISEHIPKGMIGLSTWENDSPDLRLYVDLPRWGKLAPAPKDDSK